MAPALQQLVDKAAIQDSLQHYARAVDARDWQRVRAAYHDDAYDDHGAYRGNVDGLIDWLVERFTGVKHSMHLVGNSVIEFTAKDEASVESSFLSTRLEPGGAICRQSWGRYRDRFERRDGAWRIARRTVVVDAAYRFAIAREDQ